MNRSRIFLVMLLVMISYTAPAQLFSGQRFEVPNNYSFDTKEGYHKYDNDIIKCVNWLEKTKPTESNSKIKKASDFLVEWLTGCPYVHFTQNVRIDAFMNNSPELRVYYMGGWARYALQNPGKTDKVQCCIAGIKCAIKVYTENRSLDRDADVDDIAKLNDTKLKEWVEDRM